MYSISIFCFTFYLFFGGGVHTHPRHPLPTGLLKYVHGAQGRIQKINMEEANSRVWGTEVPQRGPGAEPR